MIEPATLAWKNKLPYAVLFDDIYFSEAGMEEAEYIFITGNNLLERWKEVEDLFIIGETGFGTGLNFLVTWHLWKKFAPENASLYYYSCEKHPLRKSDLQKVLALWPGLKNEAHALLQQYPLLTPGYHLISLDDGKINLVLMFGDATANFRQLLHSGDAEFEPIIHQTPVDAWYLDGFSPDKNKFMCTAELFSTLNLLSSKDTTFATFTSACTVKRDLEKAGFLVTKRKGFGSKGEMLIGKYEKSLSWSRPRFTPWHRAPSFNPVSKEAIVLGAGLAGCFTAYALARRGWKVKLIDAEPSFAQGASGNQQAILYPKLSAYRSPFTEFMLASYLYAIRFYKQISELRLGELKGILQVAYTEKEAKAQESLRNWFTFFPELGKLVSSEEASFLAGITLQREGMFIKQSGWINIPMLCELLIESSNITFLPNLYISEVDFEDNVWHVGEQTAETLIIANGYQANQFASTKYLEIKPIRGQTTQIFSNKISANLKIPLCGEAHIIPSLHGKHNIGATYHSGVSDMVSTQEDDQANIKRLEQLSNNQIWSNQVHSQWVGVRGATTDYLPLVGAVPIASEFLHTYQGLSSNSNRWIGKLARYYPGLFICAAFGSRGLTTIPLSAEWLAAFINQEPSCLPRNLIQAISPARFLRKRIISGK
ncbi:bifunctional tRNA (5-methylaminomethyl-2-thiouridine)(34)-methyltransferase MnmD/FAD-dependent 5-carboxymethylaminomethyl-2-thiouridine(34) oxidoreductase MnmC [Legionella adelaidensis]|nr:bifunctional tRNA (5-methylaminomethyl-2-thiouridine)(34)-methyltransferase MnmD/FAD-dependent 5-carboxymethylaminomethyl-2-thiouridine(34) oxidoreductase MnmC [Legionella adelaidensis]